MPRHGDGADSERKEEVMGIADEMRGIADNIISSYGVRTKALGQIVSDVNETLGNARKTVKGFASDRKKMSAEQASFLGGFVGDLSRTVGNLLGGFQKEQKEVAENIRTTAESLRKNLRKSARDLETDVKNRLKEYSAAHAEMSEDQRKDLASFVSGIVRETKGIIDNATALMSGFESERGKMAGAWRSMSSTMARMRAGKRPVEVSGRASTETVAEAVAKPKKKRGRPKKRG
jgi:Sec-independent protein translocase protein TatA